MISTWSSPNPVLYGDGASETIGENLKRLGCSMVMVVYDMGIKSIAEKIIKQIENVGIQTIIYDKVEADAPDYTVNAAAAQAREAGVDGVVAIGGGSAVDTGKGVCVLLSNDPPISRYYAKPGMPPAADVSKLKPIIVVPTTAGTGTEVTPGGCIADTEHNTKENTVCPTALGIVDPLLTLALPKMSTIATGMDVLCHSIEAYLSNEPNMFSDILAENAISRVANYLPRAVANGNDLKAREEMHLAATLGSMSILGPFCNIGHDVGLVLGIEFHITHGIAVSCCLPEIVTFLASARKKKVQNIISYMGAEVPNEISDKDFYELVYKTFSQFMGKVDYPALTQFIPSKEALMATTDKIMETQEFHFAPVKVTRENIEDILSTAWDRNTK